MERHIGQFNSPDEVKRYLSGRTGCIRVAALRVRDINPRGGLSGLVTWGAYIMATDSWGYSRDVRCEVLAGKVIKRLLSSDATAGMGAERLAADVRADNIYSASLDGLGVTMWAVTWEQEFRLDEEIDLAALPDFLRLGATLRCGEHTEINDVIHVRSDDGTETD
ncbi:hypothetical protein LJD42_08185 [Escherichia coli]|uniref:hypothetical protein n=1 Tax=Escherichia coli TaxID=562 RepID=UPI001D0AD096|nr:hypothetical protein [Escherichia coli]MCB8831685.1 hypothetical protein [Escherichia coli]